jgi:hypothetical protein
MKNRCAEGDAGVARVIVKNRSVDGRVRTAACYCLWAAHAAGVRSARRWMETSAIPGRTAAK